MARCISRWRWAATAGALGLAATAAPAEGSVRWARAHGASAEAAATAPRAIDYGGFVWFETDEDGLARLRLAGARVVEVAHAGQVRVGAYRFDPVLNGEPPLRPELIADGETMLRLVQLAGPVRDDWMEVLRRSGHEILLYYPHHTLLMRTDGVGLGVRTLEQDFVRWHGAYHPAYKIAPELRLQRGTSTAVEVTLVDDGKLTMALSGLQEAGARVLRHFPAQPDGRLVVVVVELEAAHVTRVAALEPVVWLSPASRGAELDGELSSSITAGSLDPLQPAPGYRTWLTDLGYDGSGVSWAVTDSGVDPLHPDLEVAVGISYPGCETALPGDDPAPIGHGTPVAGVLAGTGATGMTDEDGFLYGLGVAPGATLLSQNALCGQDEPWPPEGGWQRLSADAIGAGAVGVNNSWNSVEGFAHGYQASERSHDLMVRDGDFATADVAEPFIIVFNSGNKGPDPSTIMAPKEAKNVIVVGACESLRDGGDPGTVAELSSRGPAVDGRLLPTVVAPGLAITSARHRDGGLFGLFEIPDTGGLYVLMDGTSFAAPHVSGVLAVVCQWWRQTRDGAIPSPAMAKALLVNAAVDMAGAPPVPNSDEGWGRVDLARIIRPGLDRVYIDQTTTLRETGESWRLEVLVRDPSQPLKVTLAWTDAPGAPGANPALVNDLDLMVSTGDSLFLGNHFSDGWSATGGDPDALNNLENVFVADPSATAIVTVLATHIARDGVPHDSDPTDQDFALVCTNCRRPSPAPRTPAGRVGSRP